MDDEIIYWGGVMSEQEVTSRIISAWLRDVPASAIMMHLICLGVPLKKADVLAVIRKYVDQQTENNAPSM